MSEARHGQFSEFRLSNASLISVANWGQTQASPLFRLQFCCDPYNNEPSNPRNKEIKIQEMLQMVCEQDQENRAVDRADLVGFSRASCIVRDSQYNAGNLAT